MNSVEIGEVEELATVSFDVFTDTPWLEQQREDAIDGLVITNNLLIDGTMASGIIEIPSYVNVAADNAFAGCTTLTEIIIPSNVTNLGANAFSGCTGLTRAEIREGLKTIPTSAFQNASNLTQVILPDSITSIGASAFAGCAFTEIEIPQHVTNIETMAFVECKELSKITIPENVTTVGYFIFNTSNTKLTQITVYWPDGVRPENWSDPWNLSSAEVIDGETNTKYN